MSIENTETPVDPAVAHPSSEAASELAALKASLAETAAKVLANVPEHLRGLVPASLSPSDQIAWFEQAKATGARAQRSPPRPPIPLPFRSMPGWRRVTETKHSET
jgi:hypothetical protein